MGVVMGPPLILHIGLQKTGTTFLQRHVFPSLPGTFYLHKPRQLKRRFVVSPSVWQDSDAGDLVSLLGDASAADVLVISDENLAAPRFFPFNEGKRDDYRAYNRQDPVLLAQHLKAFEAFVRHRLGRRLKVLMTIRRQDLLLSSLYAQSSRALLSSQSDFERQVASILRGEERYFLHGLWLDYQSIADRLSDVLGRSNLLIVPQERLMASPERAVAELLRFAGIGAAYQPLTEQRITELAERENVRGAGGYTWRLRGRRLRVLPRRLAHGLGIDGSLLLKLPGRRRIRLTPALSKSVLARYRESNQGLESGYGVDLANLDYFS